MHEVREARRTWFATFTLRPEAHYIMQARAMLRAEQRAIVTKELSSDDAIEMQANEVGKEITLFLKRVRKAAGVSSLRYLLVREKHKSGLPHYHALIHESGEVPIRYKVLEDNWNWGFSKFKLLEDERAATYVTKYLGKSNDGRVRASIGYGRLRPNTPSEDIASAESVLSSYLRACHEDTKISQKTKLQE